MILFGPITHPWACLENMTRVIQSMSNKLSCRVWVTKSNSSHSAEPSPEHRELLSNQAVHEEVWDVFRHTFGMTLVCSSWQCQGIWAVTRTTESHHLWLAPARPPTNSPSKPASAPAEVNSSRWFLGHTFTKCFQREKWHHAWSSLSHFSSSPFFFFNLWMSKIALPPQRQALSLHPEESG